MDTTTMPQGGLTRHPAAGSAAGEMQVLHWQAHPCWPVRHNARRALAALRAGAGAVLLVRAGRQPLERRDGQALFPTDLSPSSLDSLRLAMRTQPRMRFTLLHGCRVGGEGSMRTAGVGDAALDACRRRSEGAARAALWRFAAQLPPREVRPVLMVLRQPWHAAVAAHAAMARPDLLVLADGGGGPWAAWRWRASLRALLARTECDLLLLPPPARAD
ncbi:hypothetical protein [Massilia alkalitolerans]|uniref:hypothetical protein n=1 Tax=Massilia alkalitolerans TaxID=286638 RepID=UPI00042A6FC3|nr:hypothetical protein [Massilia alkalitolerans]